MSMPEEYRHKFVAGLHNALSGHTGDDIDEAVRWVLEVRQSGLADDAASRSRARPNALASPSKQGPDYCLKPHLR